MILNKTELLDTYRRILVSRYDWAQDPSRLANFMVSVERTIRTEAKTWNHDSPAMVAAWRAMNGKGKPTLKAMRALPD